MADTRPTQISPLRAVRLTLLLFLSPQRIADEEAKDNEDRAAIPSPTLARHRAYLVRSAFYSSLMIVLVSGAAGYAGGALMGSLPRCATTSTTAWLQIVGASVLLWGTLFVRGWEIQTGGGVSLTERINRWIYRALYCSGTALLVYSVAFPACKH